MPQKKGGEHEDKSIRMFSRFRDSCIVHFMCYYRLRPERSRSGTGKKQKSLTEGPSAEEILAYDGPRQEIPLGVLRLKRKSRWNDR